MQTNTDTSKWAYSPEQIDQAILALPRTERLALWTALITSRRIDTPWAVELVDHHIDRALDKVGGGA